MIGSVYWVLFVISLILSILYVYVWQKYFDVNITLIFLLIPVANLGFLLSVISTNVFSALTGIKLLYLGTFLIYFITLAVFNICEIELDRLLRTFMFVISLIVYSSVLLIGKSRLFYRSYKFDSKNSILLRSYGPMHTVHIVVISLFLLIGLLGILYSYKQKKQVSNRILRLLFIPEIICAVGFFANMLLKSELNLLPFTYVLAQIVYLMIIRRMTLYNVIENVIESMAQNGKVGFISVDSNYCFLGANETAREIIPEIRELSLDQNIKYVKNLRKNLRHWIDNFENSQDNDKNLFRVKGETEADDKVYAINISYLYEGKKVLGYQIFIEDDTQNQKYIALIDKYNDELEAEVAEKTRHIVEMHNNLVMSMAMMVESRDNSTGGHIKRTSVCVEILIDEMKKDPNLHMTEKFCKDVIKAAPMHDLGKIAVDDAILRKQGKLDKDEYDKMKMHSAEGARIVREILKDTDDEEFKVIAENVAHYHHEKMDGTGYPEGLKGKDIPFEARIMAIADVYDALACKRVYKDQMPLDKVNEIIMSGMGPQFDISLQPYYEKARPKLEAYYKSLDEYADGSK